jgi:hypothetical protein
MLTTVAAVAVAAFSLAAPFILLGLITRMQRARDERVARQIAVTEAIHRELGPVVAPVVTRRGRSGWNVAIAAPLDRPVAAGRILAVAYDALAGERSVPARRTLPRRPEVSFVVTPRAAAR